MKIGDKITKNTKKNKNKISGGFDPFYPQNRANIGQNWSKKGKLSRRVVEMGK